MKKLLLIPFVAVLMTSLPLVHAEEHEWTNKQGKTIKTEFVSATHEAVTISMGGKSYVVQLADLSPESQALARKLGDQNSKLETKMPSNADHAPKTLTLGEFIKGKRIYFLPPKDPRTPKDFKMPELFCQFGADGTMQLGMIMPNGKALPEAPPGKYTVDELTLVLPRPSSRPGNVTDNNNAHLTFPKTEPVKGDALSLINLKGKKETLVITRVETAKPLSKPPQRGASK